jgi:hypothetical protein
VIRNRRILFFFEGGDACAVDYKDHHARSTPMPSCSTGDTLASHDYLSLIFFGFFVALVVGLTIFGVRVSADRSPVRSPM